MEKIVFILPTLTHPRHHKRINALREHYKVKIYAFDRGVYNVNTLGTEDITVLGKVENKKYWSRITNFRKVFKIINKHKNKNVLFYFFSFDIALIGSIFLSKNNYIYEIGDFAYLGMSKWLKSITSKIDLRIMRRSLLTVFTSRGFVNYLNAEKEYLAPNKYVIIPNKMPKEITNFKRQRKVFKDSLRFGFVGVLRYKNTVLRFIKTLGEKYPQFSFIFYGDGGLKEEFIELKEKYSNLEYGGSFKNPEDLGRIYNDFDIHIGCYDITGHNQKIAEPNKLYESIYFGNPIIASKGTFFGERVKELGAGYLIDATSDENIISFLDSLNIKELNTISENLLNIKTEDLITSHKVLLEAIKNNTGSN